jgi:hypothetical protein
LRDYHEKVFDLLAVDDFAPEELGRQAARPADTAPARNAAKRKTSPRRKTSDKQPEPPAAAGD